MLQPLVMSAIVTLVVIAITQGLSYAVWGGMEGGYALSIVVMSAAIPLITCYPITLTLLLQGRRLREMVIALECAQRQLSENASRDMMTGLLHRQAFKEHLQERRAAGTLLMLDVDHFKSINDTHGHMAGDEALMQIAEALRASTRQSDLIARFGGEEFCVFLPGATATQAIPLAERIRTAIEALRFTPNGVSHPLTISIGLAAKPAELPLDAAMQAADGALYAAKRGGRNQIVCADGEELSRSMKAA